MTNRVGQKRAGQKRIGWTRALVATVAMAALAAGCTGTERIADPGPPGPVELGDIRLVAFDSCDGLLDWFRTEAAARVGPYGLDQGVMQLTDGAEFAGPSRALQNGTATQDSTTSAEAASADDATSTTNTQEPGIGEPDLTWTDGERLVTVVNGTLQIVDLSAGSVTATVDLQGDESGGSPIGLLVAGEHAVVIQQGWAAAEDPGMRNGTFVDRIVPAGTSQTRLTRVDLGADPAVVGEVAVDGDHVDARMVDGVVRAVVRSAPAQLGWVYPSGNSDASIRRAEEANREVATTSTLTDWLPSMTVSSGGTMSERATAVDCASVEHPAQFGGFDVVTVVGLDLAAGATQPLPSAAVVAGAGTVYASADHLYVTTTSYPDAVSSGGMPQPLVAEAEAEGTTDGESASPDTSTPTTSTPDTSTPTTSTPDTNTPTTSTPDTTTPDPSTPETTSPDTIPLPEPDEVRTDVHAFTLPADAAAAYEASGSVPGQLLNQFALSQHEGDLRVATTTTPMNCCIEPMPMLEDGSSSSATPVEVSQSLVTVLRRSGDELATIGQVSGLGPTEQIRGVRFAGPLAYVVTFRQTDPLYVVDLHDPTAPRAAGELKIPGFSSYLQVVGDGRVLGLGQDATETGRTTGFQESLFDVTDPSNPQRLANLVVPDAMSLAEDDHHAVLWWEPERLLAVPVTSWSADAIASDPDSPTSNGPSSIVLVTRVTDTAIEQVGSISHPSAPSTGGGSSPCPPNANCVMPIEPGGGGGEWTPQIVRTLVADGRLVTVSSAGVKVSDLATLADLAWIPLV
jgi:hypothetical protein